MRNATEARLLRFADRLGAYWTVNGDGRIAWSRDGVNWHAA